MSTPSDAKSKASKGEPIDSAAITASEEKPEAIFVTGSTMRHTLILTSTSAIGLVAIFAVDFADIFFLSLLGDVELPAAIGFASVLLFFTISICIGVTIGASAVVARAFGAKDDEAACRLSGSSLILMVLTTVILVFCLVPLLGPLLSLVGAEGRTKELAHSYMFIVMPSMPFLGLGMIMAGLLRAKGDSKRGMYVTLSAGITNAILDPIFIFGLDMGIEGAAWASVLSRVALTLVGFHGVFIVHKMIQGPCFSEFRKDAAKILDIAFPAILTNVATPFGNAYLTAALAPFGPGIVAGWAIVGRLIPVAFGFIFSLSSAVGPIVSQNLGALRIDRVRRAFYDAIIITVVYTAITWLVLFLANDLIVTMFQIEGDAASFVTYFTHALAGMFVFLGLQFVANASFNNLGYPKLSTFFNWAKATLGTIPFVSAGAWLGGAHGALLGYYIGSMIFGLIALYACLRIISLIEQNPPTVPGEFKPPTWKHALWPFSSGKSAGYGL